MKNTITVLFLSSGLFAFGQEPLIVVSDAKSMAAIKTIQPATRLILSNFEMTEDLLNEFLKVPEVFTQTTALELSRVKVTQKRLMKFLADFSKGHLKELVLRNVQLESILSQTSFSPVFMELRHVEIRHSKVPRAFLDFLKVSGIPLEYLAIENAELSESFCDDLVLFKFLTNLEHLDLSGNELGNGVLGVLPVSKPGRLKTLKLNRCDLVFEYRLASYKRYTPDFPALSYHLEGNGDHIKWNAPLFANLRHLELEQIIEKPELNLDTIKYKRIRSNDPSLAKKKMRYWLPEYPEALAIFEDTVIQRLHVFKGLKPVEKFVEFLDSVCRKPLQSVQNNFPLSSFRAYTIFANSPMGRRSENINLVGSMWDRASLEQILSSNPMPALKYVSLSNVQCTEMELDRLIRKFPQYQFDLKVSHIEYRKEAGVWPLFEYK